MLCCWSAFNQPGQEMETISLTNLSPGLSCLRTDCVPTAGLPAHRPRGLPARSVRPSRSRPSDLILCKHHSPEGSRGITKLAFAHRLPLLLSWRKHSAAPGKSQNNKFLLSFGLGWVPMATYEPKQTHPLAGVSRRQTSFRMPRPFLHPLCLHPIACTSSGDLRVPGF